MRAIIIASNAGANIDADADAIEATMRTESRAESWASGSESLYSLEACASLPEIDLLKTPLAALVGARSHGHRRFLGVMRRYFLMTGTLYRVGALLAIAVLLSPLRVGVAMTAPAGLLTLPSWVMMALTLGLDMVAITCRQFEFWYFTALNVVTWSLLASMYADIRVFSLVGGFLGTQSTILIDANVRTVVNTLRSCMVAVPAITIIAVMVFFKCIDTDEHNFRTVRIWAGVTVEVADVCANSAATLAVFVARKAYLKRKSLSKTNHGLRVIRCVVTSLAVAALASTLAACVPVVLACQRDILRALLRNFDFLFVSTQFTLAAAMLCDMTQWTARSLAVLAWFVWFQTVLLADAVTPPVRRALGVSKRVTALPLALSVAGFVSLSVALLFQDTPLLADRTLVSMGVGNGRRVSMGTKSVLLNRVLTLVVWTLRLLWEAAARPEEELTFVRGSVEYYTPLEMFPPVSEVTVAPVSVAPVPASAVDAPTGLSGR